MYVTLRKASALQHSILEVIRGITIKSDVELNEFHDAEQEIARKGLELAPKINMTATAARYGTQEAIDIMDSGGPMAAMVELQRVTNDLLRKLNTPQQVLELM